MTSREPRPGRRGSRRGAILVVAVAIVALVVGISMALGGGLTGRETSTPSTDVPSPGFSDLPLVPVAPTASPQIAGGSANSGASPSAVASPPEQGIQADRIRISRLSIDLPIVEGDGIEAPIGKAAHYPSSAWPGGGSNIYLYGHARTGMFINLWQARVGDTIELDLVDGTMRTYVVTQVLPKVPWDAMEYLDPTATEQLTLQTSTSYYATAPRFIVIAVPAS
jgi:LPXTG-site transpeptidase (sortase) family protein